MESPTLEHLSRLTGMSDALPEEPTDTVRARTSVVLSETEMIEANKDKLDLKPGVDFVTANKPKYEEGYNALMYRVPDDEARSWSNGISILNAGDMVSPQVSPENCRLILARMPKALIQLSQLSTIDYHTFGNAQVIPVPGFDEEGNFDHKKVQLVPVSEFPRNNDHPSRILVGVSNGTNIYPTPIPESVSQDQRAVYFYQVHVLLHEFFHTIDYPRRDPDERSKILLEVDGKQFTFQDWWLAFEELILSGIEPESVSRYAGTYSASLNHETRESDYKKFTQALAEQICETFVAYQLGIISNKQGWTDFKGESFGNAQQLEKYIKRKAEGANLKWVLMDKLCRSSIIKQT